MKITDDDVKLLAYRILGEPCEFHISKLYLNLYLKTNGTHEGQPFDPRTDDNDLMRLFDAFETKYEPQERCLDVRYFHEPKYVYKITDQYGNVYLAGAKDRREAMLECMLNAVKS